MHKQSIYLYLQCLNSDFRKITLKMKNLIVLVLLSLTGVYSQENMVLRFCVLSEPELAKCRAMAEATQTDQDLDDNSFGSDFHRIECTTPFFSPEDCMQSMAFFQDDGSPNVIVVDAGDVFVGGRYHSLVPILKELYDDGQDSYHSVAVIKKGDMPELSNLRELMGKHACFAGVGTQAGWTLPLYRLIRDGIMPVKDCNNHVKSTSEFFGESCAVNTLQDRYNPLGDNSNSLCEICGSSEPGVRCTIKDPYAGFQGAIKCLQDKGDIAFVKHSTVKDMNLDSNQFELLCLDGQRAELDQFRTCSWGVAPGHFVLVSSAVDVKDRARIQRFLKRVVERYQHMGDVNTNFGEDYEETNEISDSLMDDEGMESPFSIRSYKEYGDIPNLIFQDNVTALDIIPIEDQLYETVLDKKYGDISPTDAIKGVRRCDIPQMRLCVTSEQEYAKCQSMRLALSAQLIKPRLSCVPSAPTYSHRRCMEMINNQQADVAMFEAGDIYRAGRTFGLIPIMAEVYNLGEPEFYAVAVVKIRDNSSELIYLKKRNSCHTGLGQAAGWIIPISWLISNERVRDYGCDSVRAAGEYFSKSCVPGVRNQEFVSDRVYNDRNYWNYNHLCDLCHGTSAHYCDRSTMEPYYGHTGAFRCLVEGGGDVAFVKHTTVMENCDGKRKEWWARNQLTADFQLLCRDGTRKKATEYRDCYLGKVKANALVTSPRYSREKREAFINLFKYAQQYYGQKVFDEFSFSMYYSEPPFADLIFQDATQQIIVLPEEDHDYRHYLGREFVKAIEDVECFNAASVLRTSLLVVVATVICNGLLL